MKCDDFIALQIILFYTYNFIRTRAWNLIDNQEQIKSNTVAQSKNLFLDNVA